jgi:hypothetical protein
MPEAIPLSVRSLPLLKRPQVLVDADLGFMISGGSHSLSTSSFSFRERIDMPPRKRSRRSFSPEWEHYYTLTRKGPFTQREEAKIAAAFRSVALTIASRVRKDRHLTNYLELSEKAPDLTRRALYLLRALDLAQQDEDPETRRWAKEHRRGLQKLLDLLQQRKPSRKRSSAPRT